MALARHVVDARSTVDFPAPFWPIMATTSPAPTCKSTPSTISRPSP
jgi:hypothetical protein